jgi:hypothetical protein
MSDDVIQNNLETHGSAMEPPPNLPAEESPFSSQITPMNSRVYIMGDRTYQFVKHLVQVVLPALGTLYFALEQIWDIPLGLEVVGTITAICTFLGISLGISTFSYNKSDAKYDGRIVVHEDEHRKNYQLVLKHDPDTIDQSKEIIFKVDRAE